MNKLTSIRIKQDDGTYSDDIPVQVLAENVVWDETSSNSIVDIIGQVDLDTNGSIQSQITLLDNRKLNIADLNSYIASQISTDVTNWLSNNVNPVGSAVTVDQSLTISGSAADSKVVGDNITDLKNQLSANLSDHYAIKNAIFSNGYYEVNAEGNSIGTKQSSSNFVCTIVPVEAGDYVFFTAYGGGSRTAGARQYAILDSNDVIISRSNLNAETDNGYIICPSGAKKVLIQNSLAKKPLGYYAYTGYEIDTKYKNNHVFISGLNKGLGFKTDYEFKRGYYSLSNSAFPYRNVSLRDVRSALIECLQGQTFIIKGSSKISDTVFYNGVIMLDSNGNFVRNIVTDDYDYYTCVIIPDDVSYLAVNTISNDSYVILANDSLYCDYLQETISLTSGGISDSTGNAVNNSRRVRTNERIPVINMKNLSIVVPNEYRIIAYEYDKNKSYLGYTSYDTFVHFTELRDATYYIRIVIKNIAGTTINNDEITYLQNNIRIIKTNDIDEDMEKIDFKNYQTIMQILNMYNGENVIIGKLNSTGDIDDTQTNYKTTEYIKIPKKYTKNLLYTHAYDENGYATAVAFYDSAMRFIELNESASYIENDDNYVYVRATYPVTSDDCALFFSNETEQPFYVPPKRYLLYQNDLFSYEKHPISDGVVSAIVKTGLMYLGDEQYGYGTEHTAFAESCIKTTKDTHTSSSNYEGERYQVDCSTFVLLMMMGITPECSRYFYTKNIPAEYGYRFNRLVEYEGYVYGVPQTGDTKRLYANSIAEYAYKNGFLYTINDDFSNVRPGDVFFLCNQGSSYHFFENIGHCGMVVDMTPMESGGYTITTFEGNGGTSSPCRYHTYSTKGARMIYAARFPYPYVNNPIADIAQFELPENVVLEASSGSTVDLITVPLKKPISLGALYTVFVKCTVPEDCYIVIKANGATYRGVRNANVLRRPDGYTSIRMFTKKSDTLTETESITLQLYCGTSVNETITVSDVKIYEGFVTGRN